MDPCIASDRNPPARLWERWSWLLSRSGSYATRLVVDRLAEVGARMGHHTVLTALDELGTASQTDLSRRLGVDRSDLSALIDELEDEGTLVRERDEADRRRNVVRFTPVGRERFEQLDAIVAGVQEELLVPLSEVERERLRTLLTRVVEHSVLAGGPGAAARPAERT